ncbi:hypothetical protein ACFW89_36015, partial [Streptomyces albidoflavus]
MSTIRSEPSAGGSSGAPARIALSLSGGGYRATIFAAGAMLAVADSSLRTCVTSVSSVSGGSIASAVTVGGFAEPSDEDPDPMGRRVRLLAGLVQTQEIPTENLISLAKKVPQGLTVMLLVAFVYPGWRTPPEPQFAVFGLLMLFAIIWCTRYGTTSLNAFSASWYAVQRAVETLLWHARGASGSSHGTTLAEIAADEETRRIFCATDLSTGSHVYFTPGRVLTPTEVGRDPNVFVADVVAASACFPGFRPVVFQRAELGLSDGTPPDQPRRHHVGRRWLVGFGAAIGLSTAAAGVILRIFGPLDAGWAGLFLAALLLVYGGAVAMFCARALWIRGDLTLVDGGVCDNLGPAFALLSKDDRYPQLPKLAGADVPGLMLVVDASNLFV